MSPSPAPCAGTKHQGFQVNKQPGAGQVHSSLLKLPVCLIWHSAYGGTPHPPTIDSRSESDSFCKLSLTSWLSIANPASLAIFKSSSIVPACLSFSINTLSWRALAISLEKLFGSILNDIFGFNIAFPLCLSSLHACGLRVYRKTRSALKRTNRAGPPRSMNQFVASGCP
jgi:hypothetical protein